MLFTFLILKLLSKFLWKLVFYVIATVHVRYCICLLLMLQMFTIDVVAIYFCCCCLLWLLLLLLFLRLLVGSPDILADERLAHHLHDGLGLRIPIEDAPGVAVVLFFGLIADAEDLDVVEVEELLLGQLGAGVGGAAWSTPGS